MFAKVLMSIFVAGGVFMAAAAAAAEGDPAAGKKVFNQCMACHSVIKDKHSLGPSLHGGIGRQAGTAHGLKN